RANGQWSSVTVSNNRFYGSEIGVIKENHPDNVFSDQLPGGTKVVIQTNVHDKGRADLIIYNWEDAGQVPVSLSEVMPTGAEFSIHSVFDLWGDPVYSGIYQGGEISIPMGSVDPPQPNIDPSGITGEDNPGRKFGVFVLRSNYELRAQK
ncbi:hypothetical protein QLX67_13945, partial [Balneolaceae bacterium ANBcel3]|nr:hypothetical protein [Balneolaceae bacterium ANBcel3]